MLCHAMRLPQQENGKGKTKEKENNGEEKEKRTQEPKPHSEIFLISRGTREITPFFPNSVLSPSSAIYTPDN